MSGQLSMDVGRWFGSGPRYVSPLQPAPCIYVSDASWAKESPCQARCTHVLLEASCTLSGRLFMGASME